MKNLLAIVSILFVTISAQAGNSVGSRWTYMNKKDCEKSDSKVELNLTFDEIAPRQVYVREGDNVCLVVNAIENSIALNIDRLPVRITAQKGQTEMTYFRAFKAGEYKINCRGCGQGRKFGGAKLVVVKAEDFDKEQEADLRKNSENFRKQTAPRTKPRFLDETNESK